jgi:hypothetical protein
MVFKKRNIPGATLFAIIMLLIHMSCTAKTQSHQLKAA